MRTLKSLGFHSIASCKTLFALHRSKRFHKGLSVFLGLGMLLVLTGCAAVQVRLGMRTYLNKIPVTSMEAKLANGPAIAPGEKLPLVASFTDSNGKVW